MKRSMVISAVVTAALSTPIAFAQDTKAAPAKPAMAMEMGKQAPKMQDSMKGMQEQMDKARATTDPKEREKLMQEHMLAMQENMKSMHGMGGPMMMGSSQGGGMAKGGNKEMAGGNMMQHHEMAMKRMDMMQLMMEQMLQHQQVMESMPTRKE